MTRIHQTTAFLLLGCLAVTCYATEGASDATAPKETQSTPTQGQELQNFFQSSHHPLSFSFFDAASSASSPPSQTKALDQPPAKTPDTLPAPAQTSSSEPARVPPMNESPFRLMAGSTMDTIMQAIRDLKLTVAEMDEKLDRMVQRVSPEGKPTMMRQGSEMLKKMFSMSSEPVRTAVARGLGGFGGYGEGKTERGIGLSWG